MLLTRHGHRVGEASRASVKTTKHGVPHERKKEEKKKKPVTSAGTFSTQQYGGQNTSAEEPACLPLNIQAKQTQPHKASRQLPSSEYARSTRAHVHK